MVMNPTLANLQKPIMWATATIATSIVAISWPEKAPETFRLRAEELR